MREWIFVGRENANDDEVKVIKILRDFGGKVKKGEVVFEVEGSKSIVEIEAPTEGFFFSLVNIDEKVGVGAKIGLLTDDPDFDIATIESNPDDLSSINQKIIDHASKENFVKFHDLMPQDVLAKVSDKISRHLKSAKNLPKKLAAIGAGRGLSQLCEVLTDQSDWNLVGCYDDLRWKKNPLPLGFPILGPADTSTIIQDYESGVFDGVVITVSTSIKFRSAIFALLQSYGIEFPSLIHKSAVVDKSAKIGMGNLIMPFVHIGPFACVGNNNFISSFSNIEHHCILGSNNTFGPNVVFSGNVTIGSENRFGTGIYVEPSISIGDECIIASGVVLTDSIDSRKVIKKLHSSKIVDRFR